MSLIFGVSGPPSEKIPFLLNRMYEGVCHVPHERFQTLSRERAGFGHLLTYNTPEALFEKQPVYLTEDQVLITCEARLDNRTYIARQCGVSLHPELTDGALIQYAWQKWGKECVHHLQGDWSFALYNEREQELFLARDPHGYTAIYYCLEGERLMFASSPKAIFAMENFRKRINMRYLLGMLLLWHDKDSRAQAYEDLYIVPPAHTLSFKDGNLVLSRYWFPENIPPRKYSNPKDYAEELREIFMEAVRVRLRSHKPVASMLSGGLDSGSVSVMAAFLLKQEGKELNTFSHVPHFREELIQEKQERKLLDETPNIRSTVRHAGNIVPVLMDSAHISPVAGFIAAVEKLETYFHGAGNAFWLIDLPGEAGRRGYGALLSGEMGNATISYPGISYLLPWNYPAFRSSVKGFTKHLVKPWILKYFQDYYNRRRHGLFNYVQSSFVRPDILEQWNVENDMRKNKQGFTRYYPDPAAGMLHILDVGGNPRCHIGQLIGDEAGVEFRDPTGDINVIEYCLSIPNEAFFDGSLKGKQVLKTMMQGYLPDDVLYCERKGLQASDLYYRMLSDSKGVEEVLHTICRHPGVADILDTVRLQKAWTGMKQGGPAISLGSQTFLKTLMFGYFVSRAD